MTKSTSVGFLCSICNTEYEQESRALACEDSHKFVYIKFYREDIYRLLQFMITKDEQLLSKRLVDTLYKYSKGTYV